MLKGILLMHLLTTGRPWLLDKHGFQRGPGFEDITPLNMEAERTNGHLQNLRTKYNWEDSVDGET